MKGASPYERQNEPDALSAARAFRRRYTIAGRWRAVRVGTGFLIGTAGVLLALLAPQTADYVSAVAAGWIVLGRLVLATNEQRERCDAAIAQELFDTTVFGLTWSTTVTGARPAREDILNWGRKQTEEGLRDWYPDTRPARHPADVLLCQRATITWARQDHKLYSLLLRWSVGILFVATVIIGIVLDLSLGDYLLRLGVPVLPAVLDVLDIAADNSELAIRKVRLEGEAETVLTQCKSTGQVPHERVCRDLQNGIYATRLRPGVPKWMYGLTRDRRQQNMEDAVRAEVDNLPAGLRG